MSDLSVLFFSYGPEEIEKRAIDALRPAYRVTLSTGADAFLDHLPESRCVVLIGRTLPPGWTGLRLPARPPPPLVVVAEPPPPSLTPAAETVYATVPPSLVHHSLFRVVTAAVTSEILRRGRRHALSRIESGTDAGGRLPAAIGRLYEKPPVISVQSLARAAGCGIRNLEKLWHELTSTAQPYQLTDYVRAVLFLRAVEARFDRRRMSWAGTANELRISGTALRRLFRAWSDSTPSELDPAGFSRALKKVEDHLFRL